MIPGTILVTLTGPTPTDWLACSAPVWAAAGVQHAIVIGPDARTVVPPSPRLSWTLNAQDKPFRGSVWNGVLAQISTPVLFLVNGSANVVFSPEGLKRLATLAAETGSTVVYSDYREDGPQGLVTHPTIPCQLGSIRDNFDFGPLQAIYMGCVRDAEARFGPLMDTEYGAWYDLRLRLSALSLPVHVPEPLYHCRKLDARPSGQQLFDYQDPRHRASQLEYERIATEHLRRIGAYLQPQFAALPAGGGKFPVEASVIIPVRNRVKTVADAARSALAQVAPFAFNVIVVDNHSTDGTTDALRHLAEEDDRLVHLIPERTDLGIGGCWNYAIQSPQCGRVAVQLDSDDLYSGQDTLARVVAAFDEGPYAMVVGSYQLVNLALQELPPGLIDHREWTRDNGRNNLLRVNGLGAPRAFLTAMLRAHPLPDVSYGEDYCIGMRLAREYEIGRIYDSLYLCRRWEGNSDADLPIATKNQHDVYKDRLRTLEILARRQMNQAMRPAKP